jgi:hypothetical protein
MVQSWVSKREEVNGKRKGALNPGTALACRSAAPKKEDEIKGVLSAVLVVEWSVAPGQKHFKPTRAVNSIYVKGGELLCLYIANASSKCVKELVPGLARTVKKMREGSLPKAYNEVTYDTTEPEAPCLANPWPR